MLDCCPEGPPPDFRLRIVECNTPAGFDANTVGRVNEEVDFVNAYDFSDAPSWDFGVDSNPAQPHIQLWRFVHENAGGFTQQILSFGPLFSAYGLLQVGFFRSYMTRSIRWSIPGTRAPFCRHRYDVVNWFGGDEPPPSAEYYCERFQQHLVGADFRPTTPHYDGVSFGFSAFEKVFWNGSTGAADTCCGSPFAP